MTDGRKVGRLKVIPYQREGARPACLLSAPTEHCVHGDPDGSRVPPQRSEILCDWERKDG